MSTTTEPIPQELLELCRDDAADADNLANEADQKMAQATGIRNRISRRLTVKLGLLPGDTADLVAGTVTRNKPDASAPADGDKA